MHYFKITKIIKARLIESHLNLPFAATFDFFAALPQHYLNIWHMSPHPQHPQQLYDMCLHLFFSTICFLRHKALIHNLPGFREAWRHKSRRV